MLTTINRPSVRRRIRHRIRKKIRGTAGRPRLAVFRSTKHIYAQAIDDGSGKTLAAASTRDGEVKSKVGYGGNVAAATAVGELLAGRLKDAGVEQIVFDRGGYLYHGRVKALGDALRSGGVKF
jgi:large subunit ribosomal protein L18